MNLPGTRFETLHCSLNQTPKERLMAREDVAAGKMKQMRGKANDVIGAMKGDPARQFKGKMQKSIGKVQEKLGRSSSRGR